ncbi:MAG: hypothetical protein P8J37_12750 [Fuerstiella sp.]|nr:hypothetical protein [Fuerstiella sp.]
MNYVGAFNVLEALLWTVVAVILLVVAARHRSVRGRAIPASVAFLLFAGSDVMELQTGAWWRPWWLFAWKAACVVTLAALTLSHYRCVHDDMQNTAE